MHMKFFQIAVITAAIMVTATTVKAQHSNIGIKGGLNLYNLANENSNTGESIVGFHLGLISHVHLSDEFALQPEIVLSTQGSEFDSKRNLNLSYINVPLLLQYMFDNGFRLQAGPQIGFLVDAKTEVANTDFDHQDDFETIEVGAGFGIGYVNPNSNFGIDARYNLGLSDINKNSPVVSYNRGYQLGVFYLFNHN